MSVGTTARRQNEWDEKRQNSDKAVCQTRTVIRRSVRHCQGHSPSHRRDRSAARRRVRHEADLSVGHRRGSSWGLPQPLAAPRRGGRESARSRLSGWLHCPVLIRFGVFPIEDGSGVSQPGHSSWPVDTMSQISKATHSRSPRTSRASTREAEVRSRPAEWPSVTWLHHFSRPRGMETLPCLNAG